MKNTTSNLSSNSNLPLPDWKSAWKSTPGPDSPRSWLVVFTKGFAMGIANIIPGVSGGTIALITGLFTPLLKAIASFNIKVLQNLIRLQGKQALGIIHLRFLLPVLLGIVVATVSTAGLMRMLLQDYKVEVWSLFFGLIAASILLVSKEVTNWNILAVFFSVFGTIAAYLIVGLIPVQTPESLWFVFFCGAIAISAMILPGISGSFLLLILGKYEYIISAIEHPFTPEHALRLSVFIVGCICGISGFSKILNHSLERYRSQTMCLLLGFMVGAMRKIWPWKEVLETTVIRHKVHILREANILPQFFNQEVIFAIALALAGFFIVIVIGKVSRQSQS